MKKKIINLIFGFISKNMFFYHWFWHIYSTKSRIKLERNIKVLSNYDSINDIACLQEFRRKVDEGEVYKTIDQTGPCARIYGYSSNIFSIMNQKYIYYPFVEHGLFFYDFIYNYEKINMHPTVVTFGEYRKQLIHRDLKIPVFCVGPYIQYAHCIYSEEKMRDLKKKLGKTLLVFPTHGNDMTELTINEKHFLERIEEEAKDFDSVIVSAYWWNVNDSLVKIMKERGYWIVSNGFSEDANFINRQRTIIELCDLAIGDSIGTHVGYCINLKKPFCYFDGITEENTLVEEEILHQDYHNTQIEKVKKVFCNKKVIDDSVMDICRYYWGEGIYYGEDERKAIYRINYDIICHSKGSVGKYQKIVDNLINKYDDDSIEKRLLVEALSEN